MGFFLKQSEGGLTTGGLTFSVHVTKSAKANSLLGLICRSFKYLDKDNLLLLFKAIIRPHIEYANSVWWLLTRALQSELEKVQINTEQPRWSQQ